MKTINIVARKSVEGVSRPGRLGFTLVELLTVIAIIGMLGAISVTTVRSAIQTAKETRTRTVVAKIDNVLTGIYEKYLYRRVKFDVTLTAPERAFERVMVLRDLLRCDMPCTYNELTTAPKYVWNSDENHQATPLQDIYQDAVSSAYGNNASIDEDVLNAELLYLVVTNADPEARSVFSDKDIADTNGNGLFEFVDGWGRPICWMRWAPGLETSDRQPRCYLDDEEVGPDDADLLDPLGIIQGVIDAGMSYTIDGVSTDDYKPGWFLVPYVYSAGSDGKYGLVTPWNCAEYSMNDPFTLARKSQTSPPGPSPGSPDTLEYKDNIDNHTLIR